MLNKQSGFLACFTVYIIYRTVLVFCYVPQHHLLSPGPQTQIGRVAAGRIRDLLRIHTSIRTHLLQYSRRVLVSNQAMATTPRQMTIMSSAGHATVWPRRKPLPPSAFGGLKLTEVEGGGPEPPCDSSPQPELHSLSTCVVLIKILTSPEISWLRFPVSLCSLPLTNRPLLMDWRVVTPCHPQRLTICRREDALPTRTVQVA